MVQWLEPWIAISELDWPIEKKLEYQAAWERQLMSEAGPSHVLFEETASLVARRFDTDDALFQISQGRVAEVHLTWSKTIERDPQWPNTVIFQSLDVWARESMTAQHQEWAGEA